MRLKLRAGGSDAARSFFRTKALPENEPRANRFFVLERVKHWYLKTACLFVPLPAQRLLLLFPPSLTLKTGGKIRCFLGIFLGVS